MPASYPPYVNAYGNVPRLFDAIKSASVPPKFTNDFMQTVLGLKSTSYRAMIPLLKRLGFLDPGSVPTQAYRDFRDDSLSGAVMAERIKEAYADLYAANEYAHRLGKDEITSKLKTLTGAAADDSVIPNVAGTFSNLVRLAKFDGGKPSKKGDGVPPAKREEDRTRLEGDKAFAGRLGISYTINLNLPATTEIEVFNSIFKSLKQHILNEP
jgi:hypothetical protein